MTPDLSIVIPTYNRPADLELVIDALMRQQTGGVSYEVIVADNNSGEDTRAVVDRALARGTPAPLRYVREPRQGVSYARNTGVSIARSPLIAFLDDDGVPVETWVREVKGACDQHPDVDCFGFRVRPVWTTPPPSWLTPADSGPIAIQDRPNPARFDRDHAASCLLSANLACRREAFEEVGGFSPLYPRSQDREFEQRLWRAGKCGLYLPIAEVLVDVPRDRLTKDYHRKWHTVMAHYQALMHYPDIIDASGRMIPEGTYRTWLGVPRYMYRACLKHVVRWLRAALTGRSSERFHHELRIRSHLSFFMTRWATAWTAEPESRIPRATA
jgi:glycosyltransferase involved in cell wall biosynthesis